MDIPLSEIQKLEIMRMFDSYCKTVIKNTACTYGNQRRKLAEHEVVTAEISEGIYPAYVIDTYFEQELLFNVMGDDIIIEDSGIAENIKKLKKRQREIIILYYFTSMTDRQIGEKMNLSQQLVNIERRVAESKLKGMIKKGE